MKYSLISQGMDKVQHLSLRDEADFLERIKTDTKSGVIEELRTRVKRGADPLNFSMMQRIARVLPAVELTKQRNGALRMKRYNGIVVLDLNPVSEREAVRRLKRAALSQPSTVAVFVGSSGMSLKILVKVVPAEGELPQDEEVAQQFHTEACQRVVALYNAILAPAQVKRAMTNLYEGFLMPLDPEPAVNQEVAPFRVDYLSTVTSQPAEGMDLFQDVPPPEHRITDEDFTSFEIYERIYGTAARKAAEEVDGRTRPITPEYLTLLARHICEAGMPQEEAVMHIEVHHRAQPGFDKDLARSIVEAVYDEGRPRRMPVPGSIGQPTRELVRRLEQRYVFRRNTIMGNVEYRRNTTYVLPWEPVTKRIVASLVLEARMSDIDVWDVDVNRYVESARVPYFDPVEDYLFRLPKWDGNDHIRQLALTVPTRNPQQWANWFHTWFLGMVAQWTGRTRGYGNAIVPLLISAQGFQKSTFCRRILPPKLRQWGYNDNLSLSDARRVYLEMSQMLLINLDEFNAIPARKQEGFLKNIIQLPSVKVRRPYARHTEEVPRLASFIATTNMSDVLADPSGSRRFVGVEITAPIDVSQMPNYEQLYAQAVHELAERVPHWFNDKEQEELIRHNRQFQLSTDALEFFWLYFDLGSPDDKQAEWLSAAAILEHIKNEARGTLQVPSVYKFGRELRNLPHIVSKSTNKSVVYLVKKTA